MSLEGADMQQTSTKDPYEFSRGAIQLTFELLRKRAPKLAMEVRNMLGQASSTEGVRAPEKVKADCFTVDLDSFQVRAIVEALSQSKQDSEDPALKNQSGVNILATTLLNDWLALARKMLEQHENAK